MIQYIVPIIALFQGRIIDEPGQAMVETKYSTGGDVEHQVSMSSHLCKFYNGYFGRSSLSAESSSLSLSLKQALRVPTI